MSEAPPQSAPRVRRYRFFDEHRPTRAWMPTLAMINERFAQYFRSALLQHLQPPVEVVPQLAIEVINHSELIDRLVMPSHLTLASLKPLRGTILVAIDAELVGMIIESRFGGSGRLPVSAVPNREFAPIEHHAMHRVVERMLEQFALAWKPVAALEPQIVRHEVRPAFALIANSTDLIIVSSFGVNIASGGGQLMIGIPYLLLEPLHDRLVASTIERPVTRDQRWSDALQIGVGRATTMLEVELAAIELTVRDFLDLQPGSVFEIERPDTVTVRSQGLSLFRGRWGSHGRKIAVKVEERLLPAGGDMIAGDPAGRRDGSDDER